MAQRNDNVWLGIFASFTVAWGLLAMASFVMSMTMTTDELLSHYSVQQAQYLLETPAWALIGKAFAASGLLVGSVYLLLRKTSAYYWFMWSLSGTLMVMLDSILRGGFEVLGSMESGVNIASILTGLFIFWVAYSAVQDGQLASD